MVFEDFIKSEEYPFEAQTDIWGDSVRILVDLDDKEDYATALRGYISPINAKLKWLCENRAGVLKCIVDAGMIAMAEHRVGNMEDAGEMSLPIEEELFRSGVHLDEIIACCDEGHSNVTLECYLVCKPDYFSGQPIQLFVNPDLSLYCNGVV